MTGPDKEQDHGLTLPRTPTSGDTGTRFGLLSAEHGWLALIVASTAAVLLFSVYCLSHGITTIFMHLFYFPIVLLVYRYRYRGMVPAVLLSLAYVALVYCYDPGQPDVITGAWYRFLVFVGIAAVIAYLSEQIISQQKALVESERKLKLHADFATDCEFWTDPGGNYRYITPSCRPVTGYNQDEFYSDPGTMTRMIHPDDRSVFLEHRENSRTGTDPAYLQFRIIRKDGQTRWIEHVCRAMYDPQGNLMGRRGSNRDITERRELEDKIRLQNQIFETIAEGINLVRISDGVIVYTNSKFDQMFGYEKGELAGRHVSVVNAPDEPMSPKDIADNILQGLAEKGEWRGELRNLRKDGTPFWCLVVISSFEHPEFGNVWISAHTNITERKKMEDALRQANRKITMLSSITRHDIKNQLLTLRGFLGLSRMKEKDPELLAFMQKEEHAAEAISSQIEFTKFYEDIGVRAPEWQNIRELIETARSHLSLPDTLEVIVDLPPVTVFADGLIGKVFYNLMENTLRHGERVSRIRFSFSETTRGAEIVYEDNGVGISLEDKSRLFEKGFGKNTGLGLFLSQEILAITGLTIREEGAPGKGVRFVIGVPSDGYRLSGSS